MKNNVNIKLEESLEKIKKIIISNGFKLKNNSFELNIYFIPDKIITSEIKDIGTLSSYIILQDLNGTSKKIILKSQGELQGNIIGITKAKELIINMGYKEIMYINNDYYTFSKDNFTVMINDVKNQGIYLNTDTSNLDKVLEFLKANRINYNSNDLYINIEEVALKTIQN